jgi:amino acid transporter
MATAVVVGTVIGSGVFKKPHAVAKEVDHFALILLVWILVGLLAMLGALAYAEVTTLFPRAGGNYVFLREAYGRLAGFLWGWVDFGIIRSGSIAALASVFSESVHDVLRQLRQLPPEARLFSFGTQQLLTVAIILALAAVNVRGVRWGGLLQLMVTLVKAGSLIAIILLPFVVLALVREPQHPPRLANLTPIWPHQSSLISWSGFGAAMVGVIWAYHGWMNIAPIAEEVREPQRNIPIALIGGVSILIVLYVGANIAYHLVVPLPEMVRLTDSPVATEFARRLLGPVGGILMALAIALSVFGALNGNILVGPRLLYAMAEDRLAPAPLARLHPRCKTPALATWILCAWSCGLVLVAALWSRYPLPILTLGSWQLDWNLPPGKALFDVITDYAMFGAIALETLAVMSLFVFRWRRPDMPRPYRCWGYPLLPAIYGLVMLAVWLNMFTRQRSESWAGIGYMILGAVVYAVLFPSQRPRSS